MNNRRTTQYDQRMAQSPVEHVIFHSVFGAERTLDLSAVRPRLAPMADPPPSVNAPDDLALLQLTSGTIGAPKAVMLTHRNLVTSVWQLIHSHRPPSRDNAAVICILPFFHVFGFTVCLQLSVLRGFRMVLVLRFGVTSIAPLVPPLEKYRPVSFPAALWAVLAAQGKSMREIFCCSEVPCSGGAPLPARVQEQFRRLTGHVIMETYGLSEAPSTHMFPTARPERPGSIGIPLLDTDARIVDAETGERELGVGEVGELVAKGPQIMRGYWQDEALTERTLRSGWLYTGDLARMDEDGYFYLVDRKDDLIITSSFNVYSTVSWPKFRNSPRGRPFEDGYAPTTDREINSFLSLSEPPLIELAYFTDQYREAEGGIAIIGIEHTDSLHVNGHGDAGIELEASRDKQTVRVADHQTLNRCAAVPGDAEGPLVERPEPAGPAPGPLGKDKDIAA
jgi:acyl-CoA synthetase (AMP-forming)/AMP-acid ligase II